MEPDEGTWDKKNAVLVHWTAPCKPGRYKAKVHITEKKGTPSQTRLAIEANPVDLKVVQLKVTCIANALVFQGDPVQLEATTSPPGSYDYAWSARGGVTALPGLTTNNPRVSWTAANVNPNGEPITVTVNPKKSPQCKVEATTKVAVVPHAPAAAAPDPLAIWQPIISALKSNVDEKVSQVTEKVQDVATGMQNLAERLPPPGQPTSVSVAMQRTAKPRTEDQALWVVIRNSSEAISFANYDRFLEVVMCGQPPPTQEERDTLGRLRPARALPFTDVEAYRLLKVATEVFLMVHCGVVIEFNQLNLRLPLDLAEEGRRFGSSVSRPEIEALWNAYIQAVNGSATIPYLALIRDKLGDVPLRNETELGRARDCYGILRTKLTRPCLLELIWSYWHEEGMLVQTLNAISLRFQNKRGPADKDPLAHLELDPLRPLNNLLWGFIQDEQHRLTLPRRVYEYDHHYGLTLDGKAVPKLRPADSRSKFLEAFHNLLHLCTIFFKEDDDTMVIADGFPVLNSLREVHLLLTQGQHNQYGDLPSTARQEMLMQQWLLARPEMREFLTSRIMVAYPEPWMERVDTLKKLQGWTDTPVLHFRNLGVFGEQVLLSVRFGAWSDENDPARAANWARYWRPEIQGYIHAYRAVTGVDLTAEPVDATLPSVHLRQRLAGQKRGH
jgi:hypothetical protein